jgi:hypothetical protein
MVPNTMAARKCPLRFEHLTGVERHIREAVVGPQNRDEREPEEAGTDGSGGFVVRDRSASLAPKQKRREG